VRLDRWLVLAVMALVAATAALVPAVATSEGPTIHALTYGAANYWTPTAETVGAGGSLSIINETGFKHGVRWMSGPEQPGCSAGVPVGTTETSSGTSWSGTCTFKAPGTYVFWCTVHGESMKATVTVTSPGATPPPPPPGTPPPGTTTPSAGPGAGTPPPAGGEASPAASPGSPLAGTASSALAIRSLQHGGKVRGSLAISPAGAGGRLEVVLLASSAALARAGHQVQVGRLVRSPLAAGNATFAVTLNAKGKRSLRAHRRLALSVRLTVAPVHGTPVTLRRNVVLKP